MVFIYFYVYYICLHTLYMSAYIIDTAKYNMTNQVVK